jgi:hypothetical protein
MVEFRLGETTDPGSVPELFREWPKFVDQADVTFLLPGRALHTSAVVLLGAMAADRRRRGLVNRTDDGTDNALARILIHAAATSVSSSGPGGKYTRLQPIRDLRTAKEVADEAAEAMTQLNPPISPSVVRMARFVLEELGANVVQHSGNAETGYGHARVDPLRGKLELAFADAGIGFRASLQRNPDLEGRVADDAEALQLALSPRITGTSTPRTNMGIGLKLLTDFSDLLGGDLWIASGSAMLHRRTNAGQRTNVIRPIPPWQGSWICLEAPVS